MEGKRVVWTDVTKVLYPVRLLDLTATTVGEVDDFMEILHKNTIHPTIQSTLVKFRQNGRDFGASKRNI